MSTRRFLIVGLALLASGLIGFSLQLAGGESWGMPMGPMMGWWVPQASTGHTPPVPGAPTIEVEATEFAFQPERLTIDAGESVNLTPVNRGQLLHDLTADVGSDGFLSSQQLPSVNRCSSVVDRNR